MPQCGTDCKGWDAGTHCSRKIHHAQGDITMIQCWHGDTGSGLGNALWEGCVLLSHMLSLFALETEGEPTCAIKGKRCIELGCGPGLLAVTCAKLGAEIVVASDHEDSVLQLARTNVAENEVAEKVHVLHHEWGAAVEPLLPYLHGRADVIAAAEITYNDKTHKPLAESMCHLAVGKRTMNDTDTRVVMTASKRMLEDGTAEPTLFDFVNVLTEVASEKGLRVLEHHRHVFYGTPPDVDESVMWQWSAHGIEVINLSIVPASP